jgi:hypothetical protein
VGEQVGKLKVGTRVGMNGEEEQTPESEHEAQEPPAVQVAAEGEAATEVAAEAEVAEATPAEEEDPPASKRSRWGSGEQGDDGGGASRDVFVNNIAWEATEAGVRALFAAHGTIQSLRMPRGDNPQRPNSHRGIAYITFSTPHPTRTLAV